MSRPGPGSADKECALDAVRPDDSVDHDGRRGMKRLFSDTVLRAYAEDDRGRDGYPREWHGSIKHFVREQAGHRCVRCGHPYRNGEHASGEWSPCDYACTHSSNSVLCRWVDGRREARWRILTVHHLDGDKLNCRWWNLAALCQRCHLQIQGKVKMAQTYPFHHREWFKPYAAGYYAFVYLGQELSRQETLDRLDELLALELAVSR